MDRSLKNWKLAALTLVFALITPVDLALSPLGFSEGVVQAQGREERKTEADRLLQAGIAQVSAGQPQAAIPLLEQALALYRELGNRAGEGQVLKNLGNAYSLQKDWARSLDYQQQALAIARELQDRDLEARTLLNSGSIYAERGDVEQAIAFFRQSLTITRNLGDRELEAKALYRLGLTIGSLEDPSQALEYLEALAQIARETENQELEWQILVSLVQFYTAREDYAKIIEYAQQGLALGRETANLEQQYAALYTLASTYNSLEQPLQMLEVAQQMVAVAQQLNNPLYRGTSLAVLGDALVSSENLERGIETAQQALEMAQQQQNPTLVAYAFDILSRGHNSLRDYRKSSELAEQGLAAAREAQNRGFEGRFLTFLGENYKLLGEVQKAIAAAEQGLELARAENDKMLEAWNLVTLGDAYHLLGDQLRAIELGTQGLTIAKEIKHLRLESIALTTLGNANYSRGNYQEAAEFEERSLALAREGQNRSSEAIALLNLGKTYWSLGEKEKGVELLEQGLAIAREIEDLRIQVQTLGALSDAYVDRTDYEQAVALADESVAIAQQMENPLSLLNALFAAFSIYESLGDYQRVEAASRQGLQTAREVQNPQVESIFLSFLGMARFYQGDTEEAIEFARQSLQIARDREIEHSEMLARLVLGVGYGQQKDYEGAIAQFEGSLALASKLQNKGLEPTILNTMGTLYYHAGQLDKALETYQNALVVSTQNNDLDNQTNAKAGLAQVYRDLGKPVTAIAYYKQAIGDLERIRSNLRGLSTELQQSFLKAIWSFDGFTRADFYRELADLLLSQGRILEAQQVLELLKAEELRDFTRNRNAAGTAEEVTLTETEAEIVEQHGTLIAFGKTVADCEAIACDQLDSLLDRLDLLTADFNQTITSIEAEVRERLASDRAVLDPEDLGRKAQEIVEAEPGTVLIYPFVLEDKIWLLWAAQGGIVKSVEVPAAQSELAATVLKFRQQLQDPYTDLNELQATGQQLYDWLIQPLEAELQANEIKNLVFSLDRATRYIPMSALFDGEKYLIETYTVSTVLSADLTNVRDRLPPGSENTSILAMGLSNAVADFNALPNVPEEIDAIVRTDDSDPQGVYGGKEFLNEAFDFRSLRNNLAGLQILHLATHGSFVPGRPEDSYLLLGNGEKLEIPKISTLRSLKDVHLVVLSACETALGGAGKDGVEINGIGYYFLNQGAKAVMASLWLVNDASTSQLMQAFYRNLARGTTAAPITKAAALREAQLSLLRSGEGAGEEGDRGIVAVRPATENESRNPDFKAAPGFSHPYYWAPFILIGNGF